MQGSRSEQTLTIHPGQPLQGETGAAGGPQLPGDKSLSHRTVLLAALAEGQSCIRNFLVSGVTAPMLKALAALAVPCSLVGTTLTVQGAGLGRFQEWKGDPVVIDCGNSATTLRLLAGALAAWGVPAVLDGSPGLRRRPMGRIIEPLRQMGVQIEGEGDRAPLVLRPGREALRSSEHTLPVASAQVKSCLLLAGLAANGPTTVIEPGPSRDHTERLLRGLEVEVTSENPGPGRYVTRLAPPLPSRLPAFDIDLPGDISAAAFLIVAALITPGSRLVLRGVGLNPTRTGLLDALHEMGADIQVFSRTEHGGEPVGDLEVRASRLHGGRVAGERVVRMIDEFPAFAVAAAYAGGRTVVQDAAELRYKESDRIAALCGELRALGVEAIETEDGFVIEGRARNARAESAAPVRGGSVQSHGDHRLAMALAVAGLAASQPLRVQGAEMIQESFPEFPAVLSALGAQVELGR